MIADLQSILSHLEEKNMVELAEAVIGKLECMTDGEFAKELG